MNEERCFYLPEVSRQLIAVGIQEARGQSVAFLVELDPRDNLVQPKVVARSNYEAMVQVARDTTELGVLLISHQSKEFFPSEAEVSLGNRIEKHGLGFGIVSSDGQRMKILNSPAKASEEKLLEINRIEELISPSGMMKKLLNNYEGMEKVLLQFVALVPQNESVWIQLARLQNYLGKTKACLESLQKAIAAKQKGTTDIRKLILSEPNFKNLHQNPKFKELFPPKKDK